MFNDWTDKLINIAFAIWIFAAAIGIFLILGALVFGHFRAHAHEHTAGESSEQARVVEFYRTWRRLPYRTIYCCYSEGAQQDCFPVLEQRRNAQGEIEVMPDVTGAHTMAQASYGNKWYVVPVSVQENESEAGRESPDGRSHVCVNGTYVVCYVAGYGG